MRLSRRVSGSIRRIALGVSRNPLLHFVASPALAPFVADKHKRIFVRSANRTGRSRHAAKKLADAMLETPGLRCRAVAVNYKQATKVIGRYLYDFLPASAVEDDCHYTETRGWSHGLLRLKNGSTCQMMSSDQQPIAHAGDSLDIVWLDEVPPAEILDENIARVMDVEGVIWLTATPIGRPVGWLKELIEAEGSIWKQYVVEFSHENCPWYSAQQCANWIAEASASVWTYQQRILGAWEGTTVDRVFTGFDEASVLDSLPDMEFTVGLGLDHGELSGHEGCVLLAWNDTMVVAVDEYVSEGRTSVEEDSKGILDMLKRHDLGLEHIHEVIGDVNSAGKGATRKGAGFTVNELFEQELYKLTGLRVNITTPSKGPGSVDAGEWVINHALMQRRLYTTEQTPQLNHCLRHYNGKKDKHLIDALRYIGRDVLEPDKQESFGYLYRR